MITSKPDKVSFDLVALEYYSCKTYASFLTTSVFPASTTTQQATVQNTTPSLTTTAEMTSSALETTQKTLVKRKCFFLQLNTRIRKLFY